MSDNNEIDLCYFLTKFVIGKHCLSTSLLFLSIPNLLAKQLLNRFINLLLARLSISKYLFFNRYIAAHLLGKMHTVLSGNAF